MVEIWEHDGAVWDYLSYYSLVEDAWVHEARSFEGGTRHVEIVIPDATPDDGPFIPRPDDAFIRMGEGSIPAGILTRLIAAARDAGDLDPE
jgi:hypothetical protein